MDEREFLADRFEQHRPRLRAVAYRILGSQTEADDAVQETWLRLCRSDPNSVDNLGGWLTTVVGRVCLNMLRTRSRRREEPLDVAGPGGVGPDGVDAGGFGPTGFGTGGFGPGAVGPAGVDPAGDPEHEVLLADSVGVALLVVLETLTPAERLAFVLHDLFSVPFDEIAPIIGRRPDATRQLASRARRRVRGAAPDTPLARSPHRDQESAVDNAIELIRQREVVDAFLAAARGGDLDALVAVLDPDVVVRTDGGGLRPSGVIRGARSVAEGAATFAQVSGVARPALVDGRLGGVTMSAGQLVSVATFTIRGDRILAIDIVRAPERLAELEIHLLGP
jgi:RNA polymerase sigma factor (sigma-70 family)